MGADEQHAAAAPRHAWGFATVFLCSALLAGVGIAVYWAGPAAGAAAAALFALPLLYAVPRGRALWARHRTLLVATQALLTYLPFVAFGGDWIAGLAGLLGGLVLLTVAAPVSLLLFGALLAVEGVLRLGVVGVRDLGHLSETTLVFGVPLYVGVALFGLGRLAGMVTELHAARTELAELAVARERLRAAEQLRAAIGDRLQTVTSHARAALAALADTPDEARAQLTEAAGTARQALDQVRVAVADDRRDRVLPEAGRTTARTAGAEHVLAPRLARLVLALALVALSMQAVVDAVSGHPGAPVEVASVAVIVALVALQLYHSSTAWREHTRPRDWGWTLAVQLLLTSLGFFPVLHSAIHTLGGFVTGSALLLLPGWWGWAAFAGIQAAIAAHHIVVLPGLDTADILYGLVGTLTTGLVVYGLSRLTGLAVEIDQARRELARMAVVRERLRVAQDTHDLLGLGLSAVALKCDLAARLIGRDDARARAELQALLRLCAQARAEIRAVTADERSLSLRAELEAARDVLASAGIDASVRVGPGDPDHPGELDAANTPLPAGTDVVLATVLREAVTNVLRHGKATRCEIQVTTGEGGIRLRVANDGVTDGPDPALEQQPERRAGGRGLANLSARAAAVGGRLSTHAEGGGFELTVHIPLPAGADTSAPRRGGDPPAAGDPAHGVGKNGVEKVVSRPAPDQDP